MSRAFRVVLVAACPFPCPRGTPTRILRLAEALGRRGHEVHVVAYHLGEVADGPFRVHRIATVPGYHRTAPGPTVSKLVRLDPALARLLAEVSATYAIEIIHAHHYEGLLCGLWVGRGLRLPVLYDAHTLLASELPAYFPSGTKVLARAAGSLLDRGLPPLATEVVAVNAGIRDTLLRTTRIRPEHITVVPNGIEPGWYAESAPEPIGSANSTKTLIFTGNLAPYQGIDLLLRSFRRVVDRRRDVRLQIVTRWSFDPYEELARTLGIRDRIELIADDAERTPRYLAVADVALHPRPDCAGTPQKLLNYMAAGAPIVSVAASAPMLEHGKTAWLVTDAEESAFASATLHCLEHSSVARAMGAEAQRVARAGYRWETAAAEVEAVYERVYRRR